MGLDLCHVKAVMAPVDPGDYFAIEYFTADALENYGFSRFLQNIPTIRLVHTARFFETRNAFEWAKSKHATSGFGDRASYFLGSPAENETGVIALEKQIGLAMPREAVRTARHYDNGIEYGERYLSYTEPTTEKGIYYVDAGYQRKGMNARFYEDYRGDSVYVEAERFASLPSYLWEGALQADRQNLMETFVQNYERGKSMLYASK